MEAKVLKIIAWNVNSIRSKIKQLDVKHLLQKYKPHLLLLSETKLLDRSIVQFPNYKIYRNDRLTDGGGGTAILIDENVRHTVLNTPLLKSCEATCLNISLGGAKTFTIISFYCPKVLIKDDLQKLTALNSSVFVGGDFNAKHRYWHNSENNTNGNNLFKFLVTESPAELIYPDGYTCYRSKSNPSTIDLALVKEMEVTSASILEMNPDHCPVEYVLKLNSKFVLETPPQQFQYREANWDCFRDIIDEELVLYPFSVTESIDSSVDRLTRLISRAMTEAIPLKRVEEKNGFPPWLKRCVELKKKLRRTYFRNKIKRKELKDEIRRIDKEITDRLNLVESKLFLSRLSRIKPNHEMYKNINMLLRRDNNAIPPLKLSDGTLINNPVDKANVIASVYDEIHKQNRGMGDPSFNAKVESEIRSFLTSLPDMPEPLLTDHEEIKLVLKSLKNKRTNGPDSIPNVALKKLPSSAHEFLAHLINHILVKGYFPKSWKSAHVIPIPKPGKPANEPKNLRPISLLNNLSKILEKVLHARILECCKEMNLLPNNQFGFRKKHSTVYALMRLFEECVLGFNDNKVTVAAFLDIEKAFDTMWVEGLIYKMIHMKIPPYLIKITLSYLQNREFRVKLATHFSDPVSVNDGVPQGSILGPLLFIIFISDLPLHTNTILSVFADDTNAFSTRLSPSRAKSNVQSHLYKLQSYYHKWKIKVNAGKSEALCIGKSNFAVSRNKNLLALVINDEKIEYKESVRYLGYHVQSNLKHNEHVKRMLLKAYSGLHRLYPIMKVNNGISQLVKVKAYLTILRPVLTYAVAIWHDLPKYLIRKMKVFENKCLRMAINFKRTRVNFRYISTKSLHEITKTPRLNEHLHDLAKRMLSRTYMHENAIISGLGSYANELVSRDVHKPPHSLLWTHESKLLNL